MCTEVRAASPPSARSIPRNIDDRDLAAVAVGEQSGHEAWIETEVEEDVGPYDQLETDDCESQSHAGQGRGRPGRIEVRQGIARVDQVVSELPVQPLDVG